MMKKWSNTLNKEETKKMKIKRKNKINGILAVKTIRKERELCKTKKNNKIMIIRKKAKRENEVKGGRLMLMNEEWNRKIQLEKEKKTKKKREKE